MINAKRIKINANKGFIGVWATEPVWMGSKFDRESRFGEVKRLVLLLRRQLLWLHNLGGPLQTWCHLEDQPRGEGEVRG